MASFPEALIAHQAPRAARELAIGHLDDAATLAPLPSSRDRLLRAVLDLVHGDPAAQADRAAALRRSRARFQMRVRGALVDAS